MSTLAGWNPASHPFHKLLQVGDTIAAAAATFFRETYFIACTASTTKVGDSDETESSPSDLTRRELGEIPEPVFQLFVKYCRVRDSVLALMPEGHRHVVYFAQELFRDCVRHCAMQKSPEPNYLEFCIESVFGLFHLMPNECPFGESFSDADGNPTKLRKARLLDEGRLHTYSQDGRVKILFMLAELGEPTLPESVRYRDLRFRDWPISAIPNEAELNEWIAVICEPNDAQAATTGAGTQPRRGKPPAEPEKAEASPKPGKVKGKIIDARILQTLSKDSEAYKWSKRKWAAHLGCSTGSINGPSWDRIIELRANEAAHSTINQHRKNNSSNGTRKAKNKSQY